jgi:hypothetical protein
MNHASIGLLIGGLIIAATPATTADTITKGPGTAFGAGPGFQSQGLPPEESTGLELGTLRPQSPVAPNSSALPDTSVLRQTSPGAMPPQNGGG